jgi:hypothetical protein
MATNAFQAGFNLKSQKNNKDNSPSSGGGKKSGGGIPGMIGGAMQKSRAKNTLKKAQQGPKSLQPAENAMTGQIPSAKHGGRVTKGGLLRVHRGEEIVPTKRSGRKKTSGKQRTITKL